MFPSWEESGEALATGSWGGRKRSSSQPIRRSKSWKSRWELERVDPEPSRKKPYLCVFAGADHARLLRGAVWPEPLHRWQRPDGRLGHAGQPGGGPWKHHLSEGHSSRASSSQKVQTRALNCLHVSVSPPAGGRAGVGLRRHGRRVSRWVWQRPHPHAGSAMLTVFSPSTVGMPEEGFKGEQCCSVTSFSPATYNLCPGTQPNRRLLVEVLV